MSKFLRLLQLIAVILLVSCTTFGKKIPSGSGYAIPGAKTISNTVFETGLGVQIHSGRSVDLNVVQIPPARFATTIPVTGTIKLGNHNAMPVSFAVTALVNYEQTASTIGMHTEMLHHVIVNAYTDKDVDFTLQLPNQEGRYKLWWVVFVFSDKHDLDIQSRISLSKVNSFASDIMIGSAAKFPLPAYQHIAPMTPPSIGFSGGPEINRDPSGIQTRWLTDTVKTNELVPYFIHLGQKNLPSVNYALVAFLDGYQIPVQHDAKDIVFWGTIDADTFITIPATVQVPDVVGIHELELLYIPEPYGTEGTKIKQGVTPRSHSWGSMQDSLRIGLITTEE